MAIIKQKTVKQQRQAAWLMIGVVLLIAVLEGAGVDVVDTFLR